MVSLPQEAQRGWIPLIFDHGIGARRGTFSSRQSRFSRLDTFLPQQVTLPLASAVTTPDSITRFKTDYAAMVEAYLGGSWRVILVKGNYAWMTYIGTTWGTVKATVAGAQGRQLLLVFSEEFTPDEWRLCWACGAGANTQYTTDGTNWAVLGTNDGAKTLCLFTMSDDPGETGPKQSLYSVSGTDPATTGGQVYRYDDTASGDWTKSSINVIIIPATATGPIFLGHGGSSDRAYIANGPWIIRLRPQPNEEPRYDAVFVHGLRDVVCGCEYEDEFAITDGEHIALWHPSRPMRYIDIWRGGDMGGGGGGGGGRGGAPGTSCPPDMKGSVKSLMAEGSILIAFYELDAGGTLILWGNPRGGAGFTWHCRTATLTGGFPLSVGSPMVMARHTYSTSRRLWVCTADNTDGRAYVQVHPKHGWNPLEDTAMQYEDGWMYLYTPWYDLVTAGELVAEMKEAMGLVEVTADEKIRLDYRVGPDGTAEESFSWPDDGPLFNDKRSRDLFPERPRPNLVQFRLGMDRGVTVTKTPVIWSLFLSARERPERDGFDIR